MRQMTNMGLPNRLDRKRTAIPMKRRPMAAVDLHHSAVKTSTAAAADMGMTPSLFTAPVIQNQTASSAALIIQTPTIRPWDMNTMGRHPPHR